MNVSRMLALLRGLIPNFSEMSLAICPVVMIAMVLFAVQRLARDTSPGMFLLELFSILNLSSGCKDT